VVANGSAELFARAYAGEVVRLPELTINLADPSNSWRTEQRQIVFEQIIFPIHDGKGQVEAVVSCALDVTARKQTELEIQRLNNQLEQIVAQRTAELQQAVAALLVREQDIRKLNEDLEERVHQRTLALELSNKELESFSYSVSHDLRAPLRAIDGFCRALNEDYGAQLDAQGQQYLQRISAAALRMSQLIDDLLSLSRVARSELRSGAVDLSHTVSSIAAELQRGDALRQVAFVIAPDVQVSGDAYLLRIALENLLANAWKFTARQADPRIEFGQLPAPNETICYVRDNGAGFDMAYSGKLFGPFQRLHASHEFPGTGIGLATVKRIMHRHGGRIWAEGQVGQGATFYFALPG
jgi:light-regulated signal transduction histidine kinase (bacteriophytochrome)